MRERIQDMSTAFEGAANNWSFAESCPAKINFCFWHDADLNGCAGWVRSAQVGRSSTKASSISLDPKGSVADLAMPQ